tara:strand:+ start:605 stop:2524 length:1920 start_codon:yes stop_codon:yes gene_type:complete
MDKQMKKLNLNEGSLVTTTPQQVMSSEDQVGIIRSNIESAKNLSDSEILAILDISSGLMGESALKLVAKAGGGYIGNKFAEGGLQDEGGTVDPVSGNEVPSGSTQEEVRDDIPAMLSEGEFVFPADVVRFIGLEKLMAMRQKAKEGLAKMEAMGQMGNSEEAILPDDIPFDINDIEMEDDDEKPTGFAEGGGYMYNPSGEPQGVYNPSTGADLLGDSATGAPKTFNKRFVNPKTGQVRFIPFLGEPPEGTGPLYPIDDLLNEGFVYQPIAKETEIESDTIGASAQEDKEDNSIMVAGKQIREGATLSQRDIDKLNISEDKNFLGLSYLKNAPEGWNSQKQREFDAMKEEGLNPVAMWTGSDWRIYSKTLDGTEFGTPGKATKENIFKSTYDGSGIGLKSVINSLTGEVDLGKLYEQNLNSAMQKKGIQPKKIKELYGDRGFTDKTVGTDPSIQSALSPEVKIEEIQPKDDASKVVYENKGFGVGDSRSEDMTLQAAQDEASEALLKAAKAKEAEKLKKEKQEAEQARQAVINAQMEQEMKQRKEQEKIAIAAEKEKEKRDADIRKAQASKFSSMGQSDRFKTVTDAGGKVRSAESQGGRDRSSGEVNTTNLRSRSKGGLLNKKPKNKKVMKRGGLASKK